MTDRTAGSVVGSQHVVSILVVVCCRKGLKCTFLILFFFKPIQLHVNRLTKLSLSLTRTSLAVLLWSYWHVISQGTISSLGKAADGNV